MESLVILVHVIVAIGITGLVLIQHGKGADMGASFGSGASQTMFGSVGHGNALTKSTAWLATVFFATSLLLALFAQRQVGTTVEDESLILNTDVLTETPVVEDVPVVNGAASDIPQAATTDAAAQDVPVVDEALQAAAEAAAALAAEEQAAANPDATAAAAVPTEEPAEEPVQ